MRTRQEIKAIAKAAMKAQQGTAILLTLLCLVIVGVGAALVAVPGIGFVLYIATLVCAMVLVVGMSGGYTKIYRSITAEVGELFTGFNNSFARKCGGMWWMYLWVTLWSMLLYVPGIIKMYAYSMTPYILAEYPNVKAKDALKLSMRMTDGHKGELFMLQLSFIGWMMLSSLTFGILLIVYTGPYMYTSMAGYYTELRDLAIANGVISEEELRGEAA